MVEVCHRKNSLVFERSGQVSNLNSMTEEGAYKEEEEGGGCGGFGHHNKKMIVYHVGNDAKVEVVDILYVVGFQDLMMKNQ